MQPLKKSPNEIDREIGCRIRAKRQLIGYNQKSLAARIGVSYQQVQKYENGSNRVGASRLYAISKALGVHISHFFDAKPENGDIHPRREISECTLAEDGRELVLFFAKIPSKKIQDKIVELIEVISEVGAK